MPDLSAREREVLGLILNDFSNQQIADRLAVGIARHPQDWHMLQKLWL